MKIRLFHLFSITTIAIITLINPNITMAGDYCAQIGGMFQGTCEYGDCSDGLMLYPGGNSECSMNMIDNTCCVPDPNATTPPTTTDVCANGNGNCQAGWCSGGVEDPSYNDDCAVNTLETICCVSADAPESDVCANGNGNCQAGWCSDGSTEDSNYTADCAGNTFETICCVTDGESEGESEGEGDEGDEGGAAPITVDSLVPTNLGLPDPGASSDTGVQDIMIGLLNWLLIIFLIISLISFILTGLMYLFAMGSSRSELMDRAKNYFTYAVMALVITGSGLIIINVIDNFLNATL